MKLFKSFFCKHEWKKVKITLVTEVLFIAIRFYRITYKCVHCGKKKHINDFDLTHNHINNIDIKEYVRKEGEKRDKEREKDKEVWHYTCINGHKWESFSSPRGTYYFGVSSQTRCPTCLSPICRGEVWINGKITGMGACHEGFLTTEKKK